MAGDATTTQRRPEIATPVVATFLLLASVVAFVTGWSLLFPNPRWNAMWDLNRSAYITFEKTGRASGALLMTLALATACAGVGLFRRKRWAWWIAITLFLMNGLGDIIALMAKRDLIRSGSGILIAAIFVFFLTRPHVRRVLH